MPDRDFRPYLGTPAGQEDAGMPYIDLATLLLVVAGLAVAVAFAVLAGKVTAQVFFDASAAKEEER